MKKLILSFALTSFSLSIFAQGITPDLSKVNDAQTWNIINREIKTVLEAGETMVSLSANTGEGLAVYNNIEFENGTIEFDVKGKNAFQQSFVGVACHIQDEKTFNAIYFRPFNFKSDDKVRRGHAVQYICHPEFTWQKLRTDFPEQFENPVSPVPDPDNFFHAKVEVNWPTVRVFVENSTEPCLDVVMKSKFKKGKIGIWLGTGSDGTFKNLVVTKK